MFKFDDLCSKYLNKLLFKGHTLDTNLVVDIYKKIFMGKNNLSDNECIVDIENSELAIMDVELLIKMKKDNDKPESIGSVPIFYYVAAIYEEWTIDKLKIAIDEVEEDLKRTYSLLKFKKGIVEPYFLKTIELFNKNLTDEIKLFIGLR